MRRNADLPPMQVSVLIMASIVGIIGYAAFTRGFFSRETLISLAVLVPAVVLHEVSHGYLANVFGDNTAKRAGRLTLNPLRHVDPIGTFILPGLLLLVTGGSNAFGYAKPVPVDVSHMSRNKSMFVGLVGPATNVVLALLAAAAAHVVINAADTDLRVHDTTFWILYAIVSFGQVNVVLAVFNMIPIPPLDGASLIERFLPYRYLHGYLTFRKYAMFLLIFIILLSMGSGGPSVFSYLFDPAVELWAKLLPR